MIKYRYLFKGLYVCIRQNYILLFCKHSVSDLARYLSTNQSENREKMYLLVAIYEHESDAVSQKLKDRHKIIMITLRDEKS